MEPKYKVDEIVRYSDGPTALMRIDNVSKDHGGMGSHRYYGAQFYGGAIGAYESDITHATKAEVEKWNTSNHLNRLDYINKKGTLSAVEGG